jgi:hypothetical protein
MNEPSGQQTEQELNASSSGVVMTSKERVGFWTKRILVSILAIIMTGMNIYFALKFCHIHRPDIQSFVQQMLVILIVSSVLFLLVPLVLFYNIFRRRIRTGSFLPAGEELTAIRKRRKEPDSLWTRIFWVVLCLYLAISFTHDALYGHHYIVFKWFFALIMWVSVIIFIKELFRPSKRKCQSCIVPNEPQPPTESESL